MLGHPMGPYDHLKGEDQVDVEAALAAYDRQLRRSLRPPAPGWTVEQAGPVLRMTAPPDVTWGCGVLASDLDVQTADGAISAQVEYYRELGRPFEWKWHAYDEPGDLPDRLVAAGFVPDEQESLVVGLTDEVVAATEGVRVPAEITLRHLDNDDPDEDYARIAALNSAVWGGGDYAWLMDDIRAEREAAPDRLLIHVAEADGEVVCAAWVRFHEGTDFASLWGGSTLREWRGKGLYRSLVARRAREARDRGYSYLQVDASDDSLPILRRLGLHKLTDTTPYNWTP